MSLHTVRVWRLDTPCGWHVSVGDSSTLGDLRRFVGKPFTSEGFGMAWDEALGQVALALIAPGSIGPRLLFLEPPPEPWRLALTLEPVEHPGNFTVEAEGRSYGVMTLGEALATFTHLTFPREWRGFGSEPIERRRLMAASVEVAR